MALLRAVTALIERDALFAPGARLVVGVSGGPDSVCLLDVLSELAQPWGLRLYVAHLDHGLRPEAAEEAALVRALAEAHGWPFHSQRVDTQAHRAAHRQSLEEAARALRYAFLRAVAGAVGAPLVAVAHTADDQAETVLMHFLRGSGVAGLRGMRAVSPWPGGEGPEVQLVRPLLTTTRAEVLQHCAARGLATVTDPTNLSVDFLRNRLRHHLLPHLAAYNPNLPAALNRMAVVMAGEHERLAQATEALWQALAQPHAAAVVFARGPWRALSVPDQRALLRRAVAHLRPGLRDVDFEPLEAAVRFSREAHSGRVCDLAAGLCVAVAQTTITLRPWAAAEATPATVPQVLAPDHLAPGWMFQTALAPVAAPPAEAGPWSVQVDADRLGGPVRVRARRPGERFQPLGLGGHSAKLSDFMINQRLPAPVRARWPLVVAPAGPAGAEVVVWVAGLRLDERFKVTAHTRTVRQLEFIATGLGPPASGRE